MSGSNYNCYVPWGGALDCGIPSPRHRVRQGTFPSEVTEYG